MTRWLALWFLLACGGEGGSGTGSADAGRPDGSGDGGSADAGVVACAVPPGAHPSVGPGVPATGWRCLRDPRVISAPRDVVVASDGSIFVSEMGAGRILRVGDSLEVIAEGLVAPIGLRVLADGELVVAEEGRGSVALIEPSTGVRTEVIAGLNAVTYLEMGSDGATYVSSFAEVAPTGTGVVWRVDLGLGEATALATGMNVPEGLFFEGDRLRVVEWHEPSAVVGFPPGGGDTGTRLGEGYTNAYGLVSDGDGGFLVGDHAGRIVHQRADGSTEVLLEGIGRPGGMAWSPEGDLLITEFVDFGAPGHLIRLERIAP